MVRIFRDFKMMRLEVDWEYPGVFLKAKKPINLDTY
jgi:GH18 family chitinase